MSGNGTPASSSSSSFGVLGGVLGGASSSSPSTSTPLGQLVQSSSLSSPLDRPPPQQNPTLAQVTRRAQKRPLGLVCNGRVETWSTTMAEYNCPICIGVLKEAVITKCGHTFCSSCIKQSLSVKPVCPKCGTAEHPEYLIPNFTVNEMVNRRFSSASASTTSMSTSTPSSSSSSTKTDLVLAKSKGTSSSSSSSGSGDADAFSLSPANMLQMFSVNDLSLNNIESLMLFLRRKKEVLTAESHEHQRELLKEFLGQLLKIKKAEKTKLDKEVHLIEQDLTNVGGSTDQAQSPSPSPTSPSPLADMSMSMTMEDMNMELVGFNTEKSSNADALSVEGSSATMSAKRKRMYSHFEELTKIYMELRRAELHDIRSKGDDAQVPNDRDGGGGGGGVLSVDQLNALSTSLKQDCEALSDFGQTLSRISRYSRLKPLATLSYSADLLTNSNIVSSIEFDKDQEFFAIAGVTRKIKLFEYATVIGSSVDIHCPTTELHCVAKISCVSWSGYYKNRLASSDYDGCVSLWDASTSTRTKVLNEHEKRVWSVDWSNGDPRLLASGSDDSKVKLWTTNSDRSVGTLEAKANVCCVKFCPQNSFVIAFGCADHCIHYYDFRHPREPIAILTGHKKAVSYVKFASKDELVSASTDSHLRLWNLEDGDGNGDGDSGGGSNTGDCVRSFTGHINEKNFVGLATDGNYIACGSENNSLYVYYRHLSRPLLSFKFDNHRNMLEKPKNDDAGEFVSAVAWKRGSPVVVAANSQGSIKILELT